MDVREFIERVAAVAILDWNERRIMLPSVVIAQAIKESTRGTSELATKANALFGIKKNGWTGKVYVKDAIEQNPDGTYTVVHQTEWRAYDSWEESIIDHNTYIATRKIGSQTEPNWIKVIGETDYVLAVQYLQGAQFPYATSKTYEQSLINDYIEKYKLTQYDDIEVGGTLSKKVFLSAGHGGSDPGAVANGLKEKDINLRTLLACKDELERHGVKVVCSRTKDEDDPVSEEVMEANASGADIAVSFHANAGGGDGFEAFFYTTSGKGKKLAELGEKYVKMLGQNSRGIKSGNHLYFVKKTKMPAVLFESFFLDNATDVVIGNTAAKQDAFGVAYAKAILEYLGIAYKEDTQKKDKLYRVQIGAYRNKENAEAMAERAKEAGFNVFISET